MPNSSELSLFTRAQLPKHGGNIEWACSTFGGSTRDWIDCSTGISPWSYPFHALPPETFTRLPKDSSRLIELAARYYGCKVDEILPIAGSQTAINYLPRWLKVSRVAIPHIGYREHYAAWQRHGHSCIEYSSISALKHLIDEQQVQHLVLINPNNPSTEYIDDTSLNDLCDRLSLHSPEGLVIVDQAFMDYFSLASQSQCARPTNCITLRSIGKFFGLAGIRVGFIMSEAKRIGMIRPEFDTWPINGPAQYIVEEIFNDETWIKHHRQRLAKHSAEFGLYIKQLAPQFELNDGGLFFTWVGERSSVQQCFMIMAENKVLLRYGEWSESKAWCRLGLPGDAMNEFVSRTKGMIFT